MLSYAKGLYHTLNGSTWIFDNYIAVSDGRIIICQTGREIKIQDNRPTVTLTDSDGNARAVRVNRFILSSFLRIKPPIGYHADHIKEEKWRDNSLANLQWLSPGDNTRKKRAPIRERHSCIPVIGITEDGILEYPSILKASERTKTSQKSISRSCERNTVDLCHKINDIYWKYDVSKLNQVMLVDEIWIDPLMKNGSMYKKDTNIKVSSLGRVMWVKPIIRIFDAITLNTERDIERGTRAGITIAKEDRKLHELICTSFHGPSSFKGAVVRHINDDPLDCRKDNLKWGTQKENCEDAVRNDKVRTLNVTVDDIFFKKLKDAAEYLNISVGHLSNVCTEKNTTSILSEWFTIRVYKLDGDDTLFYKRKDIAEHYNLTISKVRVLERKGVITIHDIKTMNIK